MTLRQTQTSKYLTVLIATILLTLLQPDVFGQDGEWRPVTPQELAAKTSVVEPDADAEAIFWEVRIDDSSSENLSKKHYVRVKIFTERGRESYSKFDVTFAKGTKIKDLAARVIKADGSIVMIKKEDIFEREILKADGFKIKAKSFAIPNIEPGVIVEYQYKEVIDDAGAMGMRLSFQHDIPVQTLSYYYKPYQGKPPQSQRYNFTGAEFVKDKSGYYLASRTNVPSFKEEPRMPPEDMVRPWMLLTGSQTRIIESTAFSVLYAVKDPSNPANYWATVAATRTPRAKFMLKPDKDIKKAAEQVTAGAQTPDEKLRKLYEYCQTQIANTSFDTTMTDEQRAKLPEIKSVADVLKRKQGSGQYIDMLFGAMASSIGFDSRLGMLGNRSEMIFNPQMANESLVHLGVIGVQVGERFKFFNPGLKFLPYGMLIWYEEDTWAMLIGETQYVWQETPYTPHEKSQLKRTGRFNLLEDGTLEGDAAMEYTGQPALLYRISNYDETATKREEDFKEEIKSRLSTAEISNVTIENVDDASKPLIKRYKVRVPNYSQKTGKRIFLQPGFFEYGENPVFSSSTRKYDIFFRYPWSEVDNVEINYPKNYDLDNADAPGLIADSQRVASLDVKISVDRAGGLLIYNRKFHFGGNGNTFFKTDAYQPLKSLFDSFYKSDTHPITLKQK